jgi:hypothetical protein
LLAFWLLFVPLLLQLLAALLLVGLCLLRFDRLMDVLLLHFSVTSVGETRASTVEEEPIRIDVLVIFNPMDLRRLLAGVDAILFKGREKKGKKRAR